MGATQIGADALSDVNALRKQQGLRPLDRSNPQDNLQAGAIYMGQLLKKYGGDTAKAYAAYTMGDGNFQAFVRKNGWDQSKLPDETQTGIANFQSYLAGYNQPAPPKTGETTTQALPVKTPPTPTAAPGTAQGMPLPVSQPSGPTLGGKPLSYAAKSQLNLAIQTITRQLPNVQSDQVKKRAMLSGVTLPLAQSLGRLGYSVAPAEVLKLLVDSGGKAC